MEEERRGLRVAVEGCGHGELDRIYDTLQLLEQREGKKIDLLLCCGDFQAVRNMDDLECMACPPKYRHLQTFYKYYSGEKVAPIPTIFIGGNHEAANYLWELYYGGWAAPRIYFLGYAGVVRFGGLRIGGLSGIYKEQHYGLSHYEQPPYNASTMRSAYHIREVDVHRLLRLSQPLDIFLSHDWPQSIARYGNLSKLLQRKSFLRSEIDDNSLGSPPAKQLLDALRPAYWFSAHLHTKYAAVYPHGPGGAGGQPQAVTRFLALDKCLPGRSFIQVVDFPEASGPLELSYDEEWLAILRATQGLTGTGRRPPPLPAAVPHPSREELEEVAARLAASAQGGPAVPLNFAPTAPAYNPADPAMQRGRMPQTAARNPQTLALLSLLGLPDADGGGGGAARAPAAGQRGSSGGGWGGANGGITGANLMPLGGQASQQTLPQAMDPLEIALDDEFLDEGPRDPDEIELPEDEEEAAEQQQEQQGGGMHPALAAAMRQPPTR